MDACQILPYDMNLMTKIVNQVTLMSRIMILKQMYLCTYTRKYQLSPAMAKFIKEVFPHMLSPNMTHTHGGTLTLGDRQRGEFWTNYVWKNELYFYLIKGGMANHLN